MTSVMTVFNVEVKSRTLIPTNLDDKVGREQLVIKGNIQVKILTKRGQMEENRFFNSTCYVTASSAIATRQVTCQKGGMLVDLNWMSHVVIWN